MHIKQKDMPLTYQLKLNLFYEIQKKKVGMYVW